MFPMPVLLGGGGGWELLVIVAGGGGGGGGRGDAFPARRGVRTGGGWVEETRGEHWLKVGEAVVGLGTVVDGGVGR